MDRRKNNNDADLLTSSKVSDWVKKTLLTGVGAVFMTEEGIRNALSDMKMPKNVVSSAIAQADRTKREVISIIAKEVRHFLDRVKVEDIIQKALSGQTLKISATITFVDMKGRKKAVKITAKPKKGD